MQVLQVFYGSDFGGGVAFKGQVGVFRAHTASVVRDLHKGTAAVGQDDVDMCGTRVHCIFQQFFDDRGRALYHLTGRYLAGNVRRKYVDHFIRDIR